MLYFFKFSQEENQFVLTTEKEQSVWIHMEGTSSEDLQFLCSFTNLHPTDLSDALDYHELPRIEILHNILLLFVRYPITQMGHLHTIPLTFALTSHLLISISPIASPLLQEVIQKPPLFSDGYKPSKFLMYIVKRILQEFNIQIRRVRNSVMTQNKEMNAVDGDDIFALTEHEEILNQYLSSLHPLYLSLTTFSAKQMPFLHEKADKEIDDVLNAVKQAQELCSILVKNIRSLRDSYQIIFANKLTKTMRILTGLTILFSIPTMIATIYGMNVTLPIASNPQAFLVLCVIMILSSCFCGYLFYHKKWI